VLFQRKTRRKSRVSSTNLCISGNDLIAFDNHSKVIFNVNNFVKALVAAIAMNALVVPVPVSAQKIDVTAVELEYWRSIRDTNSADELSSYLKKFPNGQFADLARLRLKRLSLPVSPISAVIETQIPSPALMPIAVQPAASPTPSLDARGKVATQAITPSEQQASPPALARQEIAPISAREQPSSTGFFARLAGAFKTTSNALPLGTSGRISQPDLIALPQLYIGDTWRYTQRDRRSGNESPLSVTLTKVAPQRISFVNVKNEARHFTENWSAKKPDGSTTEDFLSFPLVQGKSWKHAFSTANDSGAIWEYDDTYEVLGEEQVSVPAGTFDTIAIQRTRYTLPRITPVGFGRSRWAVTTTYWYAPKAKRFVKYAEIHKSGHSDQAEDYVTELVSYQIN
jgi:hypothetical protein